MSDMSKFDRNHRSKYAAEFTGTMCLVLFIKLAVEHDTFTTSLSIGLGLALLVYNYGGISGAHLNPAVTMAIIIRNIDEFPITNYGMVIMYFISQFLGGIMGGFLAWAIGGDNAAKVYPTVYSNEIYYDDSLRLAQAFIGELLFTFILTSTVIHTATDKRQTGNQYYGLAIGLSLALGIACIGPISGCCLNPAVWVGTVIPAVITEQTNNDLKDFWIYWVATFLGGIIAGIYFNIFNGTESRQTPSHLFNVISQQDEDEDN
eukprot:992040_1